MAESVQSYRHTRTDEAERTLVPVAELQTSEGERRTTYLLNDLRRGTLLG